MGGDLPAEQDDISMSWMCRVQEQWDVVDKLSGIGYIHVISIALAAACMKSSAGGVQHWEQ